MNRNEKNYLKFRADHDVSLKTVSKIWLIIINNYNVNLKIKRIDRLLYLSFTVFCVTLLFWDVYQLDEITGKRCSNVTYRNGNHVTKKDNLGSGVDLERNLTRSSIAPHASLIDADLRTQ